MPADGKPARAAKAVAVLEDVGLDALRGDSQPESREAIIPRKGLATIWRLHPVHILLA